MPNQRAKNKIYIGGFVDRDLEREITRAAKLAGMERNRFGFVTLLIREGLERLAKADQTQNKTPTRFRVKRPGTKTEI